MNISCSILKWNNVNFLGNSTISFCPIRTKDDKEKIVSWKLRNSNNLDKFVSKIQANKITETFFGDDCADNPNFYREFLKKDDKILGAYSLQIKPDINSAKLEFMIEAPETRNTKSSKDFLLALSDRITDILSEKNIKFLSWVAVKRNLNATNLYRRLPAITHEDPYIRSYKLDTDAFKKTLKQYKSKFANNN